MRQFLGEHLDADSLRTRGDELHALGLEHRDRDDLTEALAAFEAARKLREQVGDEPALGMTLHEIAWIMAQRDHFLDAARLYQRACEAKETVPAERERWNDYATTLHELGFVLGRLGRIEESAAAFERALEANENIVDPAIRLAADDATLHELAHLYIERGDWAAARAALHRWLALFEHAPPRAARELYWLTFANVELENWKEARTSIKESVRVFNLIRPEERNRVHYAEALREERVVRAATEGRRPARNRNERTR